MGGFNLPPGVTVSMLPGNEPVGPCDVCAGDPEALIDAPKAVSAPECPECGAWGDPQCYENHGLVRTEGQILNRAKYEAEQQEEMNQDVLAAFAEARYSRDSLDFQPGDYDADDL